MGWVIERVRERERQARTQQWLRQSDLDWAEWRRQLGEDMAARPPARVMKFEQLAQASFEVAPATDHGTWEWWPRRDPPGRLRRLLAGFGLGW